MDGGFDPLTAGVPSRSRVTEEDEAEAEAATPLRAIILTVRQSPAAHASLSELARQWPRALRATFTDGKARPQLLVLGLGPLAAGLLHHLPGAVLCGSLALPEVCQRLNGVKPAPGDRGVCHLFTIPAAPGALVAAVGGPPVPAERAVAWANALLAEVQPARACVLDALPAHTRCAARPLAALQTDAAAGQGQPCCAPLLPAGPLIGGVAAALLSCFQASNTPARLFVHATGADAPPPEVLAAALAGCVDAEAELAKLTTPFTEGAVAAAQSAGHLRLPLNRAFS